MQDFVGYGIYGIALHTDWDINTHLYRSGDQLKTNEVTPLTYNRYASFTQVHTAVVPYTLYFYHVRIKIINHSDAARPPQARPGWWRGSLWLAPYCSCFTGVSAGFNSLGRNLAGPYARSPLQIIPIPTTDSYLPPLTHHFNIVLLPSSILRFPGRDTYMTAFSEKQTVACALSLL